MDRYVCIHGHFYQPPRENPWLEAIELQDSAFPYHDWNERITAECYAPNSAARVVSVNNRVLNIVNNYSRMSFNFGPTLLSWMEKGAPDIYAAIQQADKDSMKRYGGHGNAIAQVYNHMIMPLANSRDKRTQVLWGIADFEARFGRKPEGMWLAETAVDLESLDILAEQGIKYTILAPNQASQMHAKHRKTSHDVSGSRIDPSRAYLCELPSGRKINLFFYDGPISQAVAFEGLLASGEKFAMRLLSGLSEKRTWSQLMHIATDGETYGHHHRFGDMALAYAMHYIEDNQLAKLTNYGQFLRLHPPTQIVEILEDSAWSCAHGVRRWKDDCGCNSGGHAGWNQMWRGPLRESLNWLRDELAPRFEKKARELLVDPWAARDDYIKVMLDRSAQNVDRFLAHWANHELNDDEKTTALKLLELQRHAMLMFTSCGWFFDELSGIETVQVIQYAGRALQLSQQLFKDDLEPKFLSRLREAKSNLVAHCDGECIYNQSVKPAAVDLSKVSAHYAINSIFEPSENGKSIYSYDVETEQNNRFEAGAAKLLIGRGKITSRITRLSGTMTYGVVHLGDHNVVGGVREATDEVDLEALTDEITEAFNRADIPETIRLIDKHFAGATYSLRSLFKDEQRRALDIIMRNTLDQATSTLRVLYDKHATLMNFFADLTVPFPRVLRTTATFVISGDIRDAVASGMPDPAHVRAVIQNAKKWGLHLDLQGLEYSFKRVLIEMTQQLHDEPDNVALAQRIATLVDVTSELPIEPDLWRPQNIFFHMWHELSPEYQKRADKGDEQASQWLAAYRALAEQLRVEVTGNAAT